MTTQEQNQELLRAGAYLLPDDDVAKDVHTDAIDVRVYSHPALGGRTLARLTPQNLALGEDNAMGFLGFSAPRVQEAVAKRARQALGFPEWVLVHDIKNAQKALEVAKKLKKTARRAKSKPGHAKEDFDAMGNEFKNKLPHFLPSYYEEVARAFLEAGNLTYAASSFGKAREAEKVYALEVDENRRREAFLEFALVGALTNKVMTEYAGDLAQRHGPTKAYEYFRDLAVRRTLGGTPPHAQMITQLRKLAKAAKLKLADEDQLFVSDIWDAPSVNKAPRKYWDTYKKTYIALAKERPEIRGQLINTFPSPSGKTEGFKAIWLDILEATGALDAVTNPAADAVPVEARAEDSAATWFSKMQQHSMGGNYWSRPALPDSMFTLLRSMEARLKADDKPVVFDYQAGYYSRVDIDLLDLALELGIKTAPLTHSGFDLSTWAEPDEESQERPRDLRYVGLEPLYRNDLESAVGNVFGDSTFQKAAYGRKGLEAARRRWLQNRADEFGSRALPGLLDQMNTLNSHTSAGTFSEFPDAYNTLSEADPIPALTRTLTTGLLDEFTWPAFEEAYAELRGPKNDAAVYVDGIYPYFVLRNEHKAIVVGKERVLEHDFQLPKGHEPRHLRYSQGQLLVVFYDTDWNMVAYWSNSPKSTFSVKYPGSGSIAVELEDGSLTEGKRALCAGDETPSDGCEMVSDGTTFWRQGGNWGDITLTEYDPKTGETGRDSLPKFYEDFAKTGYALVLNRCDIYPLPKGVSTSVLGSKDGLYGWRQREPVDGSKPDFERIDGHVYSGTGYPGALVDFPASDTLRSATSGSIYNYNEDFASDNAYSIHALGLVPLGAWHYFEPRDVKASEALRGIDHSTVRALLAPAILVALNQDLETSSSTYLAKFLAGCGAQLNGRPDKATTKALQPAIESYVAWLNGGEKPAKVDADALLTALLASVIPGIDDGFLSSVKHVLLQAADGIRTFGLELAAHNPDNAGLAAADGVSDEEAAAAVALVRGGSQYYYGDRAGDIVSQMKIVSTFFRTGEVTGKIEGMEFRPAPFLGLEGVLAFGSIARGVASNHRKTLRRLIRAWIDTGFVELRGRIMIYQAEAEEGEFGEAMAWLRETDQGSRYWGLRDSSWGQNYHIVEFHPEGNFSPLPGLEISSKYAAPANRWGSADQLTSFLDATAEKDGLSFSKAAVETLSEHTGLTYGEAALLWAGLPDLTSWETNFLPKDLRTEIGLKVKEADVARVRLRSLTFGERMSIFSDVTSVPETLFDEDGLAFAESLAKGWNSTMGKTLALPEDLLMAMEKELRTDGDKARDLLTAALQMPDDSPYRNDPTSTVQLIHRDNGKPYIGISQTENEFKFHVFGGTAKFIAWLATSTPVGDEARDGLVALYDLTMDRLRSENLTALIESQYISDEGSARRDFLDFIGNVKELGKLEYADAGVVFAIPTRWSIDVFFRPGVRLKGETHPFYERKLKEASANTSVAMFEWFISEECKAIVDRIRETPVEPGQYENNPLWSAPDIVKEIGAKLDINQDAAALYAQTLALHNPTTKNVRLWNDWTAGRYKKATGVLTERELLIEAKRSRAGRKHFLPGGWETLSAPNLPIETWKLPMYGGANGYVLGQILPLKPLHVLFMEAWKRIESGDLPKF